MKRPPNFNRVARIYAPMEKLTFGPWLWRCRCCFIRELKTQRSGLVLGDGDGRFTANLLEENPLVLVDAVDASVEMLHKLRLNAGLRSARVRVHLADARAWVPEGSAYDLIATHFFLDCLTTAEVAELARRIRAQASADAVWVVSEFTIPDNWFGWLVAGPLVRALYLAFFVLTGLRVQRLPQYREAMAEAGWARIKEQRLLAGLLVGELWRAQ
ncbi:MAG: class I SAM-dependent methyltransferase [Acidobacteriota bacterium]|nr:class I SAM-dependent methyltransferase [Acidobacteriota bacterium]MDE3161828.1 class I SAM-dependent methyltransferase [Acidobacteriota bacterium]